MRGSSGRYLNEILRDWLVSIFVRLHFNAVAKERDHLERFIAGVLARLGVMVKPETYDEKHRRGEACDRCCSACRTEGPPKVGFCRDCYAVRTGHLPRTKVGT